MPDSRKADLVYFDVPNASNPLGFNPLAGVAPRARPLAASGMVEAMKKIWHDSWGPRLEHILRNALLALLDQPGASLADVLRILSEKGCRKHAAGHCANAEVRAFWLKEFEGWNARYRSEAIAPVQNKVGAFLSNPVLRDILTQKENSFDPRALLDEGKILLVNLSKGRIGEDSASLLGSLLVSRLGRAGLVRAHIASAKRRPFFLYVDEFQAFTTLSLATMLSELRKYGVGLVLAHQYMAAGAGGRGEVRAGAGAGRNRAGSREPAELHLKLMVDGRSSPAFLVPVPHGIAYDPILRSVEASGKTRGSSTSRMFTITRAIGATGWPGYPLARNPEISWHFSRSNRWAAFGH